MDKENLQLKNESPFGKKTLSFKTKSQNGLLNHTELAKNSYEITIQESEWKSYKIEGAMRAASQRNISKKKILVVGLR